MSFARVCTSFIFLREMSFLMVLNLMTMTMRVMTCISFGMFEIMGGIGMMGGIVLM